MNNVLWNSILQFDFDQLQGDYPFSVRLANENRWTKAFTESAILEYKKFMYLAAVADVMVSPSAIVDVVWHQHLIFSKSYHDFCQLLGKDIQHVPSTHDKAQLVQFKKAEERTKEQYAEHFGEQPESIWAYGNMLAGLKLRPANVKPRFLILFGVLIFCMLIVPFYYLLKPLYLHIDNPYFILGFAAIVLAAYVILNLHNKNSMNTVLRSFHHDSFVYHLKPLELVYLKTQRLSDVIGGPVNELINNGTIKITEQMISVSGTVDVQSAEQAQVVSILQDSGRIYYPKLLRLLAAKPIFRNISKSLTAFQYHFYQSKTFAKLFANSFIVFVFLLMLPLIRIITGVERDKSIIQLLIVTAALFFFAVFYLRKLSLMLCKETIPNWYGNHAQYKQKADSDWQWNYFLYGTAALNASFFTIMNYNERKNWGNGDGGCSSACGSSCGNSCGSCGGCGGD